MTEELRNQIRQDSRKSEELSVKIIQMYAEGYEHARNKDKDKLTVAKLDVLVVDSSEDEFEDEAEDDPP